MARLTAPSGAVVNVSDDRVERLKALGFTSVEAEEPKKATAKKSSSSRTNKK